MFRNYLITALRNLARNGLYAAISILGLAIAFAAALLIAQFVRNEFSYDRWVPDHAPAAGKPAGESGHHPLASAARHRGDP